MDRRTYAQIQYAAADAACLLAVLDSLVAAAPPSRHVIDSTAVMQSTAPQYSQQPPERHAVNSPTPDELPLDAQPRAQSLPRHEGHTDAAGSDSSAACAASHTAADIVRWWAERIELSGRGTLVRARSCESPLCRQQVLSLEWPCSECPGLRRHGALPFATECPSSTQLPTQVTHEIWTA